MTNLLSASETLTPPSSLSSLLMQRMELVTEIARRQRTNKLRFYRPYANQIAFHESGSSFSERLFMAGNQLGKTIAGGAEWAMHLTGRYPDWWKGATFDKPTVMWA